MINAERVLKSCFVLRKCTLREKCKKMGTICPMPWGKASTQSMGVVACYPKNGQSDRDFQEQHYETNYLLAAMFLRLLQDQNIKLLGPV